MSSRYQQTIAKVARERRLKEKREPKAERRATAHAARARLADDGSDLAPEGDDASTKGDGNG